MYGAHKPLYENVQWQIEALRDDTFTCVPTQANVLEKKNDHLVSPRDSIVSLLESMNNVDN